MNAQQIYDLAPLGALVRYSDGTPKPPARFRHKVADWERRNDQGYLIRREPAVQGTCYPTSDHFTLRHTPFREDGGLIAVIVNRTVNTTSTLTYEIVSLPQSGQVLIVNQWPSAAELVHIAADEVTAERWLETNRYSNTRIEVVGAAPSHAVAAS